MGSPTHLSRSTDPIASRDTKLLSFGVEEGLEDESITFKKAIVRPDREFLCLDRTAVR
jgi:hypothetical protein